MHTSNVYLRLIFSLYGKIIGLKTIITYHGNIGRFNNTKNIIDYLSIVFSNIPIAINENSFVIAKALNSKALILSAYLSPIDNKVIDIRLLEKIKQLQINSKVYLTNAFNLSFDKNGNEIYGISSLLKMFSTIDSIRLVIVDPSGNYKKYISDNFEQLLDVAYWITEMINFYELLKISDGFIRNTTTDGDSLSVRESLSLGKKTFATSIVKRPSGVIIYNNIAELRTMVVDTKIKTRFKYRNKKNTIGQLLDCYKT